MTSTPEVGITRDQLTEIRRLLAQLDAALASLTATPDQVDDQGRAGKWLYVRGADGKWTVGFQSADGAWHPDRVFDNLEDAAHLVHHRNAYERG